MSSDGYRGNHDNDRNTIDRELDAAIRAAAARETTTREDGAWNGDTASFDPGVVLRA